MMVEKCQFSPNNEIVLLIGTWFLLLFWVIRRQAFREDPLFGIYPKEQFFDVKGSLSFSGFAL